MPTATWRGGSLHYATDGPADGHSVAFVNPVGYGAWVWGWHQPALAGPRETVVWDLPGTGRSDPVPDLDVDSLADGLETVLADHETPKVHLVGAGLGGMVALRYARRFGRARSLTLLATAATGEAVDEAALEALALPAEASGTDARAACREGLAGAFTPGFREAEQAQVDAICDWRLGEDATGAAWTAQAGAMTGFRAEPLYEVAAPALVCHGVADPVVPEAAGRSLASDLPRGQFEAVEGRHLAFVERARAVTDRLEAFFTDVEGE